MDSKNLKLAPKPRVGLKREFEFAHKSHAEISGSNDLTRCRQNQNAIQVSERGTNKRSRKYCSTKNENVGDIVLSEKEVESNVFDLEGNGNAAKNEIEANSIITTATTTPTQVKKSKVASSNSKKFFPSKLSDLMNSGILEGLNVKYARGAKVRRHGETILEGVISGNGIRCHCENCKGVKVVRPTLFEVHAGSSNKRPSEFIFLDNEVSLKVLMNTFLTPRLHNLEEHVQKAIGDLTLEKSKFCLKCRDVNVMSRLLCNSCVQEEKKSQHSTTHETSDRSPEAVVPPKALLNNGMEQSTSSDKSHGRQTRKDHSFHKLVFQNAQVLPEGTELAYYASGKKVLEGYKDGIAIRCNCCNSKISPSQFEAHAGYASRRNPYLHIYTSKGVSLHALSKSTASEENQKISTTNKDEGGLLCCENTIQEENNENAVAVAERIAGVDSVEQININQKRSTRKVEHGGCALCRRTDFSKGFGPRTVMICDQCEREFHVGCLKEQRMQTLKELPEGDWFCCSDCGEIHNALRNLVAHGEDHLPNSLFSFIKTKDEKKGSEPESAFDIRWRVLNNKLIAYDDHEAERLLSRVVAIFQDRFDPIVDPSSGKDFISAMLEGKSINNQDFRGMYCAVLTVKQEVVCAGVFRVFGQEVAELPLAATNKDWEGQGYFGCLLSLIERQLTSLKVRQFVLPAADEAESMWTNSFGFTKLEKDEIAKYRTFYDLMMFQRTSLLKKPVPSCHPHS